MIGLCLPTKSLSLTASMLFRLMEAKSSSVRKVTDRGGQAWHVWSLNASGYPSMQVTVNPCVVPGKQTCLSVILTGVFIISPRQSVCSRGGSFCSNFTGIACLIAVKSLMKERLWLQDSALRCLWDPYINASLPPRYYK